MLNTEMI